MIPCPPDWNGPGCSCRITADEPSEDCWIHGYPDTRVCPNCGQIRGRKACKRCGCTYGIPEPPVKAAPCMTDRPLDMETFRWLLRSYDDDVIVRGIDVCKEGVMLNYQHGTDIGSRWLCLFNDPHQTQKENA